MGNVSVRSTFTTSGEIRPMTGVRGLAALAVTAHHFFDQPRRVVRPWQHGYLAVDLFFMLSGLVLAMNDASTVSLETDPKPYMAFLKKRIARIFPLYLFSFP